MSDPEVWVGGGEDDDFCVCNNGEIRAVDDGSFGGEGIDEGVEIGGESEVPEVDGRVVKRGADYTWADGCGG